MANNKVVVPSLEARLILLNLATVLIILVPQLENIATLTAIVICVISTTQPVGQPEEF